MSLDTTLKALFDLTAMKPNTIRSFEIASNLCLTRRDRATDRRRALWMRPVARLPHRVPNLPARNAAIAGRQH